MASKPDKGGRPTKCTPELTERICIKIRAGNHVEAAVKAEGLSVSAFYRWQATGKAAKRGKFREFVEALEKAKATGEVRNVALIQKAAADGYWQAAAWLLERMYRERWGRRVAVEHSGTVTAAPERPDLSALTDDELETYERLTAKATPKPQEQASNEVH